jgi:hypothetical protein
LVEAFRGAGQLTGQGANRRLGIDFIDLLVLRQFHCDFSLTARQFGFSKLPQAI